MATLMELTAEIVKAHAGTTALSTEELLATIGKVYNQLRALEGGEAGALDVPESAEEKPALTIRQAFRPNEVVCMICGKGGMKTLTRHLRQAHDLKPGQYRKQFGIPASQPLTAKKFSESRRLKAQEINLSANLAKAREVRAAKLKDKKSGKKAK